MKRLIVFSLALMTWAIPIHVASALNEQNVIDTQFINYQQIRERQKTNQKPVLLKKAWVSKTQTSYSGRTYSKEEVINLFRPKILAKWGESEWVSMLYIINKESGANPYAINKSSGACGIPQALPCSKLLNVIGSLDNVEGQVDWMINYIAQRYGTPTKAVAFHKIHNWY